MRFPRALAIREDLNIDDCLTASGAFLGQPYSFYLIKALVVLDSVRSDRKRKMSNESPKYVPPVWRYLVSDTPPGKRRNGRSIRQKRYPVCPINVCDWLMVAFSNC